MANLRHFFICLFFLLAGVVSAGEKVWITMAVQDLDFVREVFAEKDWTLKPKVHKNHTDVVMIQVEEDQVPVISRVLHEKRHRCGGFVAHESYEQAIAEVQRDLLRSSPESAVSKMAVNYTMDRATEVNATKAVLSESNILSTITQLSSYTTRYYTSSTAVTAANWIKTQLETMAAGRSDVSVQLYSHSWAQPSVIMTITGAHQPQEIIVVGGHEDSINQSGTTAPGADDDASGVATFMEVARALLSKGYVPARTVKFIAYAAEEVGLRGSADIAAAAQAAGDQVVGVMQLDMTNYKGSSTDIVLMQDYTNAAQNTFVGSLIDTYTTSSWATDNCGYGCSDHASWHNRGYATSMPFESYMNQYNPFIHTANDTLAKSNNSAAHAMKFAQLATAFVLELAKGGLNNNPGPDPGPIGGGGGGGGGPAELTNGETLTGLSGSTGAQDNYFIDVPAGATNLVISTSGGSGDVDLYVRQGAQPTTSSYDCRPYKSGNAESCTFASPAAGKWYIMLNAYSNYSGVSLSVSFTEPGGGGGGCTPGGWTESNLSGASGSWKHFPITVPSCATELTFTMSGGTGDADLYTRFNAQPTTSSYACRPYKNGNSETCTTTNPSAGTWYGSIRAYSTYSGVTLTAAYQ